MKKFEWEYVLMGFLGFIALVLIVTSNSNKTLGFVDSIFLRNDGDNATGDYVFNSNVSIGTSNILNDVTIKPSANNLGLVVTESDDDSRSGAILRGATTGGQLLLMATNQAHHLLRGNGDVNFNSLNLNTDFFVGSVNNDYAHMVDASSGYSGFNINNPATQVDINGATTMRSFVRMLSTNPLLQMWDATSAEALSITADMSAGHFDISTATTHDVDTMRLYGIGSASEILDLQLVDGSLIITAGTASIGNTSTGSNAGTDLCIDANNNLCRCGSCA